MILSLLWQDPSRLVPSIRVSAEVVRGLLLLMDRAHWVEFGDILELEGD